MFEHKSRFGSLFIDRKQTCSSIISCVQKYVALSPAKATLPSQEATHNGAVRNYLKHYKK